MSYNLHAIAQNGLGNQVSNHIADVLNEESENIQLYIDRAIPAIIAGLMQKASTPSGADSLLYALAYRKLDHSVAGKLKTIITQRDKGGWETIRYHGQRLAFDVFEDDQDRMVQELSHMSGVDENTGYHLLYMLLPVVMGYLGTEVENKKLDNFGLANLLMGQKFFLKELHLPEGFMLRLGLPELHEITEDCSRNFTSLFSHEKVGGGFFGKMIPVLGGFMVVFAVWSIFNVNQSVEDTIRMETGEEVVSRGGGDEEKESVLLPDGNMITVYTNGAEMKLINHLTGTEKLDENTWIVLERVSMNQKDREDSIQQLDNLGKIMMAYSYMKLVIGSSGEIEGERFSVEKAEQIKNELMNMGVGEDRLKIEDGDPNGFIAIQVK
ncbi:DUF937 domain-containing protein [Algivirga pacifica]|uniref:Uncharacterized protein n=1 Tax=Algivirga pacifica TaxID=1162670 RepID=A0ABP9DJH2_9BACT